MTEQEIFSLKNKRIFLSGATGHLGASMAIGLAKAGARVIINSPSEKKGGGLYEQIISAGFDAEMAIFDITDEEKSAEYFLKNKKFPLDCLINNAYKGVGGTIETATTNNYRDAYEISVVSVHQTFINSLSSLRKAVEINGGASVINIASMYATVSPNLSVYKDQESSNPPFYGAAKAALVQWTKYAACEFGLERIRVNAVSPGPFPSMVTQEENPDLIKTLSAKVPLGRIGRAEEILGAIIFLASDASSYVNGANISVDGGWTAW